MPRFNSNAPCIGRDGSRIKFSWLELEPEAHLSVHFITSYEKTDHDVNYDCRLKYLLGHT